MHPKGAYASPKILKGNDTFRELTDILLTYEFGTCLVESKTLTILGRNSLPSRNRLARNLARHVQKATSQLRGAIRKLKQGVSVQSAEGKNIEVESNYPMHAIVLIPELDLVENCGNVGLEAMYLFADDTDSFLHVLDIAELLRVVQASEIIASYNEKVTPMMAFDYYLTKRWEYCVKAETLLIRMLLRQENFTFSHF